MSFIPGGTSRLYLEEISEPDHFRCTQENPQHECSSPSARTPLRRRRIDSQGLKRRMGIRVGLDSSAALKSAYRTPQGISATSNSNSSNSQLYPRSDEQRTDRDFRTNIPPGRPPYRRDP